MYLIDPQRQTIDFQGRSIISLIQSINQPLIAAADYPAEETQAYVITLQAGDRSLSTYIFFHLQRSNQSVIYYYDQAPFMGDRLVEAETEAVDFVESMGFMMDNLRYDRLPEAERERLQKEIPLFYASLKEYEPILRKREKRADDPLAVSDASVGEKTPHLEPSMHAAPSLVEADLLELEEIVEVDDLEELSELSEALDDASAQSHLDPASSLSKLPPLKPAEPSEAREELEMELSDAFSEMAPDPEPTLVLGPKPGVEPSDESLGEFFDIKPEEPAPVAPVDDLHGLGEIERSLSRHQPTGFAPAPAVGDSPVAASAAGPRREIAADDWKQLLMLLLSV